MVSKKTHSRGFSLIELLVALAISALITAALLVRFSIFDSVVVLKNLAYELALTIRESQVYALSAAGDTSGFFRRPYGVYIADGAHEYYLFEDTNTNLRYDSGVDTIVNTYQMNSSYFIESICTTASGSAVESCNRNWISIVFQRPEFDPIITTNASSNDSAARIQLGISSASDIFSVQVGITGQIGVESM